MVGLCQRVERRDCQFLITRWGTDKAAQLNPDVEAARGVLEFEDFLFGRDRVALERIAEGLLDLQRGVCLYCQTRIGRDREIDHISSVTRTLSRCHGKAFHSSSSNASSDTPTSASPLRICAESTTPRSSTPSTSGPHR
jgi:hypothetical protein